MGQHSMRTAIFTMLGILCSAALPCLAQQPPTTAAGNKGVQVTGLPGVKAHAKGILPVESGNLQFANSKSKVSVPLQSVEDVVTDNDSQRVFRGTFGTLTMFAPYGGGRF